MKCAPALIRTSGEECSRFVPAISPYFLENMLRMIEYGRGAISPPYIVQERALLLSQWILTICPARMLSIALM